MPIYEYKCDQCQTIHDVMQKFSDAPMTHCPDCGSQVQKLISRSSFALKGTGWYTSDYKRGGSSSSTSAQVKTESKSETCAAPACGTSDCAANKSV